MAYGAQSAQFRTVWIADQTNTLIELSQYVRSAGMQKRYKPVEQTTLATGGGYVTRKQTKGAYDPDFEVEFVFDPTVMDFLTRIKLKSDGVLCVLRESLTLNTAPAISDAVWQGTFTLVDITVTNYQKNQLVTVVPNFVTTDNGAVIPDWYIL